jgi:hypothetical protein
MNNRWCLLLNLVLLFGSMSFSFGASGTFPNNDWKIYTSASKQFVVRGPAQRSMLASGGHGEIVYIDPSLLTVTCETIRREMARELGWGDRWRGNIYINVRPIQLNDSGIALAAIRSTAGWHYRLDIPDEVQRRDLVQAVVEALLREFADRTATETSVELPPWLSRGLTAHLLQGPLAGVTFQPRTLDEIRVNPDLRAARTLRHSDVDERLRKLVHSHGTLTFDQLNWPDFDPTDEQALSSYTWSAHLFVRELLKLRGGPDALCATLAMLPEHLNWQTAFLRGFDAHFRRMVDVEKWWSLSLARIKVHDNALVWSPGEARRKLEDILYTPMQLRVAATDAALAPVSLQTVINDWTFEQQTALLHEKINQLQVARVRLPKELALLAEGYRAALEKYLRNRSGAWFAATGRLAASRAVEELNALDQQRTRVTGNVLTAHAPPQATAPETGSTN